MKGYCPHFGEVMDLENCYFCLRKIKSKEKETR
jgi:hypothetical protein